jgi:hypothetical protein
VLVPSLAAAQSGSVDTSDVKALCGSVTLPITETSDADVTMHVDLRRQLRAITDGLPLAWLIFQPDATHWLAPESATFLSDTVGALMGVGLGALTRVACAYRVPEPPTLNILGIPLLTGADTNATCRNAAGSAVVQGITFRIDYLPPGRYGLRLFVGDLVYADVPGLFTITAGLLNVVDL